MDDINDLLTNNRSLYLNVLDDCIGYLLVYNNGVNDRHVFKFRIHHRNIFQYRIDNLHVLKRYAGDFHILKYRLINFNLLVLDDQLFHYLWRFNLRDALRNCLVNAGNQHQFNLVQYGLSYLLGQLFGHLANSDWDFYLFINKHRPLNGYVLKNRAFDLKRNFLKPDAAYN